MRLGALALIAALPGALLFASANRPAPAADPGPGRTPVPVLVELFTSEGCSSCPPADEVLSRLAVSQPVPGALVIPLGEHVDYWDHLGWRDPFSSPQFSERQSDYASRRFGADRIYTPQLVVNGRQELVGSDYAHAVAAIAREARSQEGADVAITPDGAGRVAIRVQIRQGTTVHGAADVMLATTEDHLGSDVRRGENHGRHLDHVAIVRRLVGLGRVTASDPSFNAAPQLALDPAWRAADVHVVVFVQEHASGRVLGAARLPILPTSQ